MVCSFFNSFASVFDGFTAGFRVLVESLVIGTGVIVHGVPVIAGGLLVIGIITFLTYLIVKGGKASKCILGSVLKLRFFVTSSFRVCRLFACVFVRNNFRRVLFGVFTL